MVGLLRLVLRSAEDGNKVLEMSRHELGRHLMSSQRLASR